MRAIIDQIVNLQQIHSFRAQAFERFFHLPYPGVAPAGPNFGREKKFLLHADLGGEIAGDAFGSAIHRRGVDDASAQANEFAQNFFERRTGRWGCAHVEGLPGAETDGRQHLAGFRDGLANDGIRHGIFSCKREDADAECTS